MVLKGTKFEKIAKLPLEKYLKESLEGQFQVEIGYHYKKNHKFDLGNSNYIIECKNYEWTEKKIFLVLKFLH